MSTIDTSDAGSNGAAYSRGAGILLALPLILLLLATFIFPVGRLLLTGVFAPEFTLAPFQRLFSEPVYVTVFLRTFRIALIVTIAALLLGYPVAWTMAQLRGRWAAIITACVLIPLWTSALIRSYVWIVLLQRNGVINNALRDLGITSQPLKLIYNEGAVIMAMTHVLLPYMILPIYTSLRNISPDYARASRNLGASAFRAFTSVTFPLSVPGVIAGCLIVFILSLGFYITPALVGGAGTLMVATLIGQQALDMLDWPFASALSAALLISTIGLALLFRRFLSKANGI